MLSFIQFISEQKLRQGLPNVRDLNHEQVGKLLSDKTLSGTSTRKTDGAAGEVGWDENGFYTRSARSDKVRNPGEYSEYTKKRIEQGKNSDPHVSAQYDEMHSKLQNNPKLVSYLKSRHKKGLPSSIKGEFFLRGLGQKTEKGLRFVGTSYNPSVMGKSGMFIMHHQLPENSTHNPEEVSKLGDHHISFDHDKSEGSNFSIDVSSERDAHSKIDTQKLTSRKAADKESKEQEKGKLQQIKDSLEKKLSDHANRTTPRPWEVEGESEGDVFHTKHGPVKVQSQQFKQFKQEQKKGS